MLTLQSLSTTVLVKRVLEHLLKYAQCREPKYKGETSQLNTTNSPKGNTGSLIAVYITMKMASVRVSDDCSVTVDFEDGNRDSFLLVHGLASNARIWDGVANELRSMGHGVAMIDQRGHGKSDKPGTGYDFATISQDLALVTRELQTTAGFGKPIIVGQSWGAAVAESFASKYPDLVKGVVAVDGGMTALSESFPDWSKCKTALAPPNMLGIPWEHFESLVRASHPDWPEGGIQGVLANMERLPDGTFRPWLSRDNHFQILWHLWQFNPFDVCSTLTVPILFVAAGSDPSRDQPKADGIARLTNSAKSSKSVWFTPADHDLHAQYPVRFANLLDTELREGILS